MNSEEEYEVDPTLNPILDRDSLNWIFVGGKGGVGKTTTSCAIAYLLAKRNKKVLLLSTDPAHNISDALGQPIGDDETKVEGVDNLYAMEISSKKGASHFMEGSSMPFLSEIIAAIPGIDEAVSFAELMKQVKNMKYDVIIFDTAPTGHTLKFLGFPGILEKGINKAIELKTRFSGLIGAMGPLLGQDAPQTSPQGVLSRLEETKAIVEAVNEQISDAKLTTFVCVCIAEFLSVYETTRLVEALDEFGIDHDSLVVNQVLFPDKNSKCTKCTSRVKMQNKYLKQINDLFDSHSIVTAPLLDEEVRGIDKIAEFSKHLLKPYGV